MLSSGIINKQADVCGDPTERLKWGQQFSLLEKTTVKVIFAFERQESWSRSSCSSVIEEALEGSSNHNKLWHMTNRVWQIYHFVKLIDLSGLLVAEPGAFRDPRSMLCINLCDSFHEKYATTDHEIYSYYNFHEKSPATNHAK